MACRVAYEAGSRGRAEVEGGWSRSILVQPGARLVRLQITPLDLADEITSARILIDGAVRAEHRGSAGQAAGVVHLVVELGQVPAPIPEQSSR